MLSSLLAFSHFFCDPPANWALLVLIPMLVVLCTLYYLEHTFHRPALNPLSYTSQGRNLTIFVGLSNELSCEAGSFPCCRLNPPQVFQSEALRLYFPELEPWVAWPVSLPSCSFWFICTQIWDWLVSQLLLHLIHLLLPCLPRSCSHCLATSPLRPAAHLQPSYQSG